MFGFVRSGGFEKLVIEVSILFRVFYILFVCGYLRDGSKIMREILRRFRGRI